MRLSHGHRCGPVQRDHPVRRGHRLPVAGGRRACGFGRGFDTTAVRFLHTRRDQALPGATLDAQATGMVIDGAAAARLRTISVFTRLPDAEDELPTLLWAGIDIADTPGAVSIGGGSVITRTWRYGIRVLRTGAVAILDTLVRDTLRRRLLPGRGLPARGSWAATASATRPASAWDRTPVTCSSATSGASRAASSTAWTHRSVTAPPARRTPGAARPARRASRTGSAPLQRR